MEEAWTHHLLKISFWKELLNDSRSYSFFQVTHIKREYGREIDLLRKSLDSVALEKSKAEIAAEKGARYLD